MELPSFIFQAQENLVERPWGGEWISTLKGFRRSGIGESWEFSAHPSNPSHVLIRGQTLSVSELFSKFKDELLGRAADKFGKFPILLRLIDVAASVPIHVHPSDKVAEMLGEREGGVEAVWLIFNKGKAYVGFKENVKMEELEEKLKADFDLRALLNCFETNPYDTFLIPPGLPHCGEGLRVLEVSSNSTLAYFFKQDWEKVKKALNTKKTEEFEVRGRKGKVEAEKFGLEVVEVSGSKEIKTGNVMNILFAAEGYFILRAKEVADLHRGYSCLVPAVTDSFTVESERGKIVRVYLKP